jgi:hypothetical protein
MRVRILKTFGTNGRAYSEGDEVSIPDEEALGWIKVRYAQRIADEPRKAVRPEPELAVSRGRR